MTNPKIKNNLWWAIPSIATLIITSLIFLSPGGAVDIIGGAYHAYCAEGTALQPAEIISSKGSPHLVGVCGDNAPYVFMVPGNSTVGQLLLILPVFSAIIAMIFMRISWKTLAQNPDTENQSIEARSLFIGFAISHYQRSNGVWYSHHGNRLRRLEPSRCCNCSMIMVRMLSYLFILYNFYLVFFSQVCWKDSCLHMAY